MSESTNPEAEGEAAVGATPVTSAGPDAATAAPSPGSAQALSEQPSAGSGNPVAVGFLISGLLIAIIGGVVWRSMWKKASMQAFADSLYGLSETEVAHLRTIPFRLSNGRRAEARNGGSSGDGAHRTGGLRERRRSGPRPDATST